MSITKFTVSRDDEFHEGWPDVTLTESGKLICVFTECIGHGNRDMSRLMLTESSDRGRTWTKKHPLTERGTVQGYFNCARISTLPDGRLVVLCDKSYGYEAPGTRTEVYVWFSSDEGETWSEPILVPGHGYAPDKYRVLSTGRHVICIHDFGESGMREQY
ncbi:MAG: exo-alpha-sialidase, partial [Ruminococcus sp.]|nr:exo-alpha-sialidase [Candidatus Apopatosoma intestinale]